MAVKSFGPKVSGLGTSQGSVNVTDGEIGNSIYVGNTAPSAPSFGDVWIDNTGGALPTQTVYDYTATGGETSVTTTYAIGAELVFLNGVKLSRGTDYTATNGTSITGLTALVAGDLLEVVSMTTSTVTGSIPASTITTAGDLVVGTGASAYTRLAVGTNGQVLTSNGTTPTYTSTLSGVTANNLTLTGTLTAASSSGTSGQVLSSTGTGTQWTTISSAPWTASAQTSAFTAVTRNQYFVNTGSAVTVTMPASASLGDEIRIFDATGSAATNNITVAPNGLNIQGSVQNLLINVNYGGATLLYTGSTYGWKVA